MNNGVFILLGSNQGHTLENLIMAQRAIRTSIGKIIRASSVYKTSAWGKTDQPDFYNQVIEVETSFEPGILLEKVLLIENELGRKRKEKWGPRIIDIDILIYQNRVVDLPALTIPHPGIPLRKFTLAPLAEIAPDLLHPILNKNILTLLKECPDSLPVEKTDL
ncbi:MAG: 2-amino-4-hydroxy-6-hydroxymethyldihydropteridine diphosphokinase [Bacteroidota bacterium]